jgi:NADH-ubiquinone oxidoreductase chain 4
VVFILFNHIPWFLAPGFRLSLLKYLNFLELNCLPLTVNFIGEFMCLYGTFEQLPVLGALASSSIVFSAAYTIYMFNRIAFGGSYSRFFQVNIPDINKREFIILITLVCFTVVLGIYPAPVLDGLHYSVSGLIYNS